MTKSPNDPPLNANAGVDAYAIFAHRESHDAYSGVIVDCRGGWRVIIDKLRSQYITQQRSSSTIQAFGLAKAIAPPDLNLCASVRA